MKTPRKSKISPVVVEVGNKIKEIIIAKKMRQRDVAHDAGLDVENLRKYMQGYQEMKISTMTKIATALAVEVSELFQKENDGQQS